MFNLRTTDGTYFADGILVHNCDALSGAFAVLERGLGSGAGMSGTSAAAATHGAILNPRAGNGR